MKLEIINVGNKPNDGTADILRDAWIKSNNNFEKLSKVFNLKLKRVKETNSLADVRPNMIIMNENFKLIENRLEI